MRRYHYGLLLLVVLVVLALIQTKRVFSEDAAQVLGEALAATGVETKQLRISGWVRLKNADLSDKELLTITEDVIVGLGVSQGSYKLRSGVSEGRRLMRAEFIDEGLRIVVSTRSVMRRSGAEAYLVVNVEDDARGIAVDTWHKKVAATLAKVGEKAQITTCLVGWLDGKLEKDDWGKRLDNAGRVLNMAGSQILVQPNYVSMAGFSPGLPGWLEIADKRINVNMAVRYSPYENRTYVFIGSPVITGEY